MASNPIYSGVFTSHQTLPSAQLDALVFAINNHDHGTEAGGGLPVNLAGVLNLTYLISAGLQINSNGWALIQPLGSDPGSPVTGQIWLRTDF